VGHPGQPRRAQGHRPAALGAGLDGEADARRARQACGILTPRVSSSPRSSPPRVRRRPRSCGPRVRRRHGSWRRRVRRRRSSRSSTPSTGASPPRRLLAYQYLQVLPQLARGDANKMWIIPSELTDALRGVSSALGGNGGGGGGGGGFDEEWVEPAPAPAAAPPIQRAREFGDPEVIGDAQPH
jgi:hypothetical protein